MGVTGTTAETLSSLLAALELARRVTRYYPEDHPAVREAVERLQASGEALPADEYLIQVRPRAFFVGEEELHRPGHPARRLATELFAGGIVALVLEPPISASDLGALVEAISALPARPGPQDRAALLEKVDGLDGVDMIPLDVTRFVFWSGKLSVFAGKALWKTLVTDLTGGALGSSGEGGLDPQEMAQLVEVAGDPTGFLALLVEHLLRLLGEAEERQAVVEGFGLIKAMEEMVQALSPERRSLAARLMVQHAAPPESLASRVPEVLEPALILEATESLLQAGIDVPIAVQRLVYQLAAPPGEAKDPWRSRGLTLEPDTVDRARVLLQRLPGLTLDSSAAQSLEKEDRGWAQGEAVIEAVREAERFQDALTTMMSEAGAREELETLLELVLDHPGVRKDDRLHHRAVESLAAAYLEHLELGEFAAALRIVEKLTDCGSEALSSFAGSEGLDVLLAALSRWGKENRREVMAIANRIGESMVPAILTRLAEERHLSVRKRLMEMVVAVGRPAIPHLPAALLDRRWFVVRNALLLLRRLKDPDLAERARPLVDHEDPRVVSEAVLSLVAAGNSGWVHGLDRLLASDDPSTFHEGIALAVKLHHPDVGKRLVGLSRSRSGAALRQPETLELIEALGAFPSPEVEKELDRLIGLAQWRLPFRLTSVWEATARAAAKLPDPAGRRLLEKLVDQRDASAKLASRLLEERRGGQS